jgi:hypothetical protein
MAILKNNLLTGISGKFGGMVFRQRGGKTVVAKAPKHSDRRTPAQIKSQSLFAKAAHYAKAAIADSNIYKIYKSKTKKNQSVFNLALSDFLQPPQIGEPVLLNYMGLKGDRIDIPVVDKGKIVSVKVYFERGNRLLEMGEAVQDQKYGSYWIYTIQTDHWFVAGIRILVTAIGLSGRSSIKQFSL